MPRTRRSRLLAASPQEVWSFAADPGKLPRWWPDTERVERSSGEDYTRWVLSPRGRAVAMRFRLGHLEQGASVTWNQEIEGSIFERSLRSASERLTLHPRQAGTLVELEIRRRMRGTARFGAAFIARAQKQQLERALDRLEEAVDG